MMTRDFTEKERASIKECFLCNHTFGAVQMPAIEFITTVDIVYVPVDFTVIRTLGERTKAPYECYKILRKKVDIDTIKIKLVPLEDNFVYRITMKV